MVTKTQEELAMMTPDELKAHYAAEERTVFGHDFRRDRHGNPIEIGLGAPGHETENHFRMIRKYEGEEAEKAARAAAAERKANAGEWIRSVEPVKEFLKSGQRTADPALLDLPKRKRAGWPKGKPRPRKVVAPAPEPVEA